MLKKLLFLLLPLSTLLVYALPGSALQQRDLSKLLWEEIVKLSFQPSISESHLNVPAVLNVDILSEVKPREVIVRARVTSTGAENNPYVEFARTTKQSRGPTGFDRFKVMIPSCEHVGNRLEVEVVGATNKYKVYSRSYECTTDPPRTESK
jgi:hypothetical protein